MEVKLTHKTESTVIIAALLLIFYKLYLRKREARLLKRVTWAIGHTNQVRTPYNDGGGGFAVQGPASTVLRREEGGVWMGPGVVVPQPGLAEMQQLGGERPLGSNPPSFHQAHLEGQRQGLPVVEHGNPFLSQEEKALPAMHEQHDIHQFNSPPQIYI